MTELLNLFVYGTLRPPQADTPAADARYFSAISEYTRHHQPATLAHAQLYDLGEYPAAAPGVGTIHGDLLQVDPAAVPIADRIEGHPTFYRRAEVMVQTAIGAARAWVYWAPPGMTTARPRIRNGDWFRRQVVTTSDHQLPQENATENATDPALRALVTRFAAEPCSWLSSVRPGGRAHLVPVWHIWHQGRAYVVTPANTVKTLNIRENPSVTIAHPDPRNVLIIEGWAIATNFMRDILQPLFLAKYNWDIAKDAATHTIIEITPTKLLAWGSDGEGKWVGTDVLRVW